MKIERILTSDVLRAHSYVGARGWQLEKARPAGVPAALDGFRVVFGYRRRDGRRALLVRDASGALFLCELPSAQKGGAA